MNYPAASGEVSAKDEICFIVASDGVLDPQGCNKEGTGHGRLKTTDLTDYEANSLIQSVGLVAEFLLNRLK